MNYPKSQKYDNQFVGDNLMGPNALKMVEELTLNLNLHPGMRVLDLGSGKGLTSIFLAKEFGVQVFATDLWISATENYDRFKKVGLDNRIIPIHADANMMPYADEYFDAVISVDAYYYFGMNETFMDEKLAPLIKPDGIIALAFPGFKKDIHGCLPPEFLLSWTAEDLETFHSCEWWSNLFLKSKKISLVNVGELSCHDESWADWLATDNPYAVKDKPAMAAGAGTYMNLISVLATRKG